MAPDNRISHTPIHGDHTVFHGWVKYPDIKPALILKDLNVRRDWMLARYRANDEYKWLWVGDENTAKDRPKHLSAPVINTVFCICPPLPN
jgi:hypothetical protein